jgi:hypothetical protein
MREAASLNAMANLYTLLCGADFPAKPPRRRERCVKRRKSHSNYQTGKSVPRLAYNPVVRPLGCGGLCAGEFMYPLFYWTGLATFLAWTVLSVYTALHGF